MGNLVTRPPDATTVDASGVRVTQDLLDQVSGRRVGDRGVGDRGGAPRDGRRGEARPARPAVSPLEAEAARLASRDATLAAALRRSTIVGGALLKVEADEAAAVDAMAARLLADDAARPPPPPVCGDAEAALMDCFRSAGPAAGTEGACEGAVEAYERCARAATAERVAGRRREEGAAAVK